jgi:hypothetical protein
MYSATQAIVLHHVQPFAKPVCPLSVVYLKMYNLHTVLYIIFYHFLYSTDIHALHLAWKHSASCELDLTAFGIAQDWTAGRNV